MNSSSKANSKHWRAFILSGLFLVACAAVEYLGWAPVPRGIVYGDVAGGIAVVCLGIYSRVRRKTQAE